MKSVFWESNLALLYKSCRAPVRGRLRSRLYVIRGWQLIGFDHAGVQLVRQNAGQRIVSFIVGKMAPPRDHRHISGLAVVADV